MSEITSKNYDGTLCKLIDADTGEPVQVGDIRTSGNGERFVVTGGRAPHKDSSSGRVYVRAVDDPISAGEREYFPNVVGAHWSVMPGEPQ